MQVLNQPPKLIKEPTGKKKKKLCIRDMGESFL